MIILAQSLKGYNKELWSKLYKRYFNDKILELANAFPENKRLIIPYNIMEIYFIAEGGKEALDYLTENPIICFTDANDALHNYILPIDTPEEWNTINIEISGYRPAITIRDIRIQHLNKYVSVTGVILRKTDVKFQISEAVFECIRCGHKNYVKQDKDAFTEPFECENDVCGRKGPFRLLEKESTWVDKRKIRLQETFEHIRGGEQNLSVIDAVLLGNVECPSLGSIVTVSGILKPVQTILNNQKTDYYPVLEINHIEVQDKEKSIEPTPEDIKIMEDMAKDENIIDRLVASTVTSVRGHEQIKEACLCSQVSPDNILLPDGRKLRGYSHIMLCGDPGVAKSVMLQAMIGNVPRAQYAAGRSASARGLTVAVTKDKGGWGEGAWVAEAGMLVLADRAFAVIDELDKFEKEEQRDLNTVLEHGIIPVRKAGINRDFFARVPIVASLNPKYGRFDRYEPITKQLNVPPDTLSRFDLIFTMFDEPNPVNDAKTTDHITNLWQKATEVYQTEYETTKELTDAWGKDKYVPEISLELMRKWIYVAKKIKVRITSECRKAINDHFLFIRLGQSGDKDAAIPIVWRTLDGMMRLLICQTRLRHGKVTEMRDVDRVKILIEESFKVMIDPATGKLDSDIISTGISRSLRDKIRILKDIIKEIQQETKDAAPLEYIMAKGEAAGMKPDNIQDMIEKLKTVGELMEVRNDRFRVVD